MGSQYALLWLEAPLQSWGADSKFGRRDTLKFPTKSGVFGLILCGMGASGAQIELLEELNCGEVSVVSYVRTLSCNKTKEPLLCDFHMVGSGYNKKDPWETLLIPKTNEGKPAVGGGAKMTYRYYLQDAFFAVVLEVDDTLVDRVQKSLESPVYDLYLGRKNCVPTDFIFRGFYHLKKEAFSHANIIAKEKNLTEDFSVIEGEHEGDVFTLNDVPLEFGEKKKYTDRRVTLIHVDEDESDE